MVDQWVWRDDQKALLEAASGRRLFVRGAAGTGKTQAAVERLRRMLAAGIPGHTVTVLAPQPLLARPYHDLLASVDSPATSAVNVLTFGGLTRRMVSLYWPMVAESAGFAVTGAPTFLDSESAQWAMAKVVEPLMSSPGFFETVRLPRARIYGQILDNMNKAALVGFGLDEIGRRLAAAWSGEPAQVRVYDDVQAAADAFRKYCLTYGLLDYSLTVEVFVKHVWPLAACQNYLKSRARHILYENSEEDVPAAHRLMADLIADSESALVLFDEEASYRRFLGADEFSAYSLASVCDETVTMGAPVGLDPARLALIDHFGVSFGQRDDAPSDIDPFVGVEQASFRFFPQMVDAAAAQVSAWVKEDDIAPNDIAVVVPYLSDALRFALTYRLEELGVPSQSLRPSRPLRLEPVVRALVTFAQMAHPQWGLVPQLEDIALALTTVVGGLDPVRAALLASTARKGLVPFEGLAATLQERVTYRAGERYERLRGWLETYRAGEPIPLDHFFSRLYGEVLSQAGFTLQHDLDAAQSAAALVDSAAMYRLIGGAIPDEMWGASVYLAAVMDGVLGQRSLSQPDIGSGDGVLMSPAYTFLMTNRRVQRQIWLDVGSSGWTERLSQPLAQPYVLSAQWPENQLWTSIDETAVELQSGYRLVAGLLRRCGGDVVMMMSEYGEQGMQQQGALLYAIGRILRRTQARRG